MTCIAWDGESLSADRRSMRGLMLGTQQKLFAIRGHLVATAGSAVDGQEWLAWWRDNFACPSSFPEGLRNPDNGFRALVITPEGKVWNYENSPYPMEQLDKFFAVGCGAPYATTAMYLGHDSKRAVEVACALDAGCGGPIDTIFLKDIK